MSGKSSINCYLSRFLCPCFSNQDNIWILPQYCLETSFIIISFIIINLRLLNSANLVFNWIFQRNYFLSPIIKLFEDSIERSCLSRSSRTCNNNDSCCFLHIFFQKCDMISRKSNLFKMINSFLSIKKSDHNILTLYSRHKVNSGINFLLNSVSIWCLKWKPSILW